MIRKLFQRIHTDWTHGPTRKTALLASAVVGAVMVGLIIARPADADIVDIAIDSIASGFSSVLLWVAALLGKLLVVVIDIVIDIAQYNDFANAPVVVRGWSVVRDVANMFFVLVLLVISFGTILKIDSYRYQRLLPKLVIMAVLINFSKLIATFFIDLSQVIMLTFVNAFADTAAANFTSALKLRNMLDILPSDGTLGSGTTISNWELVGVPLLANIMLIVALMVMIVILVTLLVRMIALWILVVLSPLAYLASTLPMTSKYSGQWWSTFGKWITTGPILAFFLWLSLAVLGSGQSLVGETEIRQTETIIEQGSSSLSVTLNTVSSSENLLGFMLGIAMLAISLSVANGLGGTAGRIAGAMGDRLKQAGSRTLKIGAAPFVAPIKWAGIGGRELAKSQGRRARRWYEDKAPAIMQPWNVYKGASERGQELDRMTRSVAQAKGREFWERATTGGAVKIPHRDRAEAAIESQFAKDYAGMTKEEKAESARLLYDKMRKDPKDPEMKRRMRSLIRVAAEGGHLDDILEDDYFRHKAKWTALDGKEYTGYENKSARDGRADESGYYSRDKLNIFLRNALGGGGKEMNDQDGLRLVYDLEEIGKKGKHEEYGGHSLYNSDKGEHYWLDPKDNSKALSEYKKGTGRQQLGASPHTFTTLRKVKKLWRDPNTGNFGKDTNGNFIVEDYERDDSGNYKLDSEGKKIPVAERSTGGRMTDFNRETFLATFRSQPANKITEHSQVRTASFLLGGAEDQIDKDSGAMVGDKTDKDRIKHMLDEWYQAPAAFWKKIGGEGLLKFDEIDENGQRMNANPQNVFDIIVEHAQQQGKSVSFNADGSLDAAHTDQEIADQLHAVANFYTDGKEVGKLSAREQAIADLYMPKSGKTSGGGTPPPPPPPGGTPPPPPPPGGTPPPPPPGGGTPPPGGAGAGSSASSTSSGSTTAQPGAQPKIKVESGRTQSGGRERVTEGAEPTLPPEATQSKNIQELNGTIEALTQRLDGMRDSVQSVDEMMRALGDGSKALDEYSKKLKDQSIERHGPQATLFAQSMIDPLVQRFNQLQSQQGAESTDERLASAERLKLYTQMRRVMHDINDRRARAQGADSEESSRTAAEPSDSE